jgi:hypothetical protein
MEDKKTYWAYVKGNTPIFTYLFLGVVGFFLLYWVVFQTGYERELVWTLSGIATLSAAVLTIHYFKWRKL